MVQTRIDTRRAALERLIDHAALFPPASMSMDDAVEEDRRLLASPEGWLVGRFVVPASRLGELGGYDRALTVVLDRPCDTVSLRDSRVESVEVPPGMEPPDHAEVYVERSLDDLGWLEELGGRRAKARCGGKVTPTVAQLAAFVRRCRELGVVFKATAGLHHPLRRGDEHGFLNLLAAAVFGDEERALAAQDVTLDAGALRWGDRAADAAEVARVRRELFTGFGSCSVAEPVEDLQALGIL